MTLEDIAFEMRKRILKLAWTGRSGHIGTSLSATDILVELYFDQILRYDSGNPDWESRDRFILSKGHASLLFYNVLAKAGYFSFAELKSYCQPGSRFGSHPTISIPGVEASTGALGHGYSYAAGVALAAKMDLKEYLVYALLGDGECQEGSIWEAASTIAHYKLSNLVTIVDYNGLQATDYVKNIVRTGDFRGKWSAWGFEVVEIDGNDLSEIKNAIQIDRTNLPSKPRVVIAHTIKGKGIPMIENNPQWHSRIPSEAELQEMLTEMNVSREEFEKI